MKRTFKTAIKTLSRYPSNDPIILCFWTKSDMEDKASLMGVDLADDEIVNIMEKIDDESTADEGVNWDVIEDAINGFIRRRDDKIP